MTPSLLGRWQTRILLFIFIGLPITYLFASYLDNWNFPGADEPYWILFLILIVGLVLDPIYIFIQGFRWDQDWPFAFQFFFSIIEFLIVLFGIDQKWFTQVNRLVLETNLTIVILHFTSVFLVSFFFLLGGIQIFNLRWRFNSGKVTRF